MRVMCDWCGKPVETILHGQAQVLCADCQAIYDNVDCRLCPQLEKCQEFERGRVKP